MIKIESLRIGNWVKFIGKNEHYQIGVLRSSTYGETNNIHFMGNGIWNREDQVEGIPLTPEILINIGFTTNSGAWYKISFGKEMVGEDGLSNLLLGQTNSPDGLPYHIGIEQNANAGFTIQEAAAIQIQTGDINDDAFFLKKRGSIWLRSISYLHQLQNIYYSITGQELNYNP